MESQVLKFQEARNKLNWLKQTYSNINHFRLAFFELDLISKDGFGHLLSVLRSDKVEIKRGENESLHIKFSAEGYGEHCTSIPNHKIIEAVFMMKMLLLNIRQENG